MSNKKNMKKNMKVAGVKLSPSDWLAAALDMLYEKGIEKVKVEPLAIYLGVTKGSFYWHFKNLDALLTQMIDYWEAQQNEIIDRFGEIGGDADGEMAEADPQDGEGPRLEVESRLPDPRAG